jgi:predicted transcriptional regulator
VSATKKQPSSAPATLLHGDINRIEVIGVNAIGRLEEELLDIIWRLHGPVTVSDVHKQYWATKKSVAYTTIMTTMNRLTTKGVLKREQNPDAQGFIYTILKTRDQLRAEQSQQVAEVAYKTDPDAALEALYQKDPSRFLEFARRKSAEREPAAV